MEGSAWWRGFQLIVIRYLFLVIGKGGEAAAAV